MLKQINIKFEKCLNLIIEGYLLLLVFLISYPLNPSRPICVDQLHIFSIVAV